LYRPRKTFLFGNASVRDADVIQDMAGVVGGARSWSERFSLGLMGFAVKAGEGEAVISKANGESVKYLVVTFCFLTMEILALPCWH